MYGLLLESISGILKEKYGEDTWAEIHKKAAINHHIFATHKSYSETLIPRIAKAASEITGDTIAELMELFGCAFVGFVGKYGYDRILRVLGRHLRDFLNNLDNLHEYLRFSYPKLRPPSFFCTDESYQGLTLHYRTKRRGYIYYVMGQIKQVGKQFYNTDVEIEVLKQVENMDTSYVIMRLHFENLAYKEMLPVVQEARDQFTINSELFFDVFPFHIVFNKAMVIRSIGQGLNAIMPHILKQAIDEMFHLHRPILDFNFENVLSHTNNIFELTSLDPIRRYDAEDSIAMSDNVTMGDTTTIFSDDSDFDMEGGRRLRLKGQMMYMDGWESVIFLGTPVMENLEKMFDIGLYINDLSMHDSSRDLVLAGTQQSAELKLALDQEQQKSKKLEESMKKLDIEMKRTDLLLYQMIPKAVADRLRKGEPAVNTCEVFDQVTILFSDVVGFTHICSQITPMQVVSMLNAMYTQFDNITEKHRVYKVETIGDAYMVVSGAPTKTKFHALYVCDMAFDMLKSMNHLVDPSTQEHMQIRVGIHSGTVVAGVVGLKMPRYCLFGDSVNTASRMESNGEAMKIHVSETTYEHLQGYPYVCEFRSTIEVKGKGQMKTYWLSGKTEPEIGKMQFSALSLDDKDLVEESNRRDDDVLSDTSSLYAPVLIEDVEKIQHNRLSPRNNEKIWNKQRENMNNKLNEKENPTGAKGT